jgi:tetratricopeptide (TPR) repeat protein
VNAPRHILAWAALVAAVAPGPRASAADWLDEAERELLVLEQRLGKAEQDAAASDAAPITLAARRLAAAEEQYALGDWLHASILLSGVVGEREAVQAGFYPRAVFLLADSMRNQGSCHAAAELFSEVLAMPASPDRGAAAAGALDCALKLGRYMEFDALAREALRASTGTPSPEVLYLAAKGAFFRRDIKDDERIRFALEAFSKVPPPYHVAARYFEGVLELQAKRPDSAFERFHECAGLPSVNPAQTEIREYCTLALGRIHASQGRYAEALERFRQLPVESIHFDEAEYESAWALVKAGKLDQALRVAEVIADLAPDSITAPQATILQGHLQLRLGRYSKALEAYNRVINTYAPVRDEIDAILTMHEDPARYFEELVSHRGKAFDVSALLPPLALRWATHAGGVAGAIGLAAAIHDGRDGVQEAEGIADRIEAALTRGGAVDAFPALRGAWTASDAVETASVWLEAGVTDRLLELFGQTLPRDKRTEMDASRERRRGLEKPMASLPRTLEEADARQARLRERMAGVEREASRFDYTVAGCTAAIDATELWVERYRAQLGGDAEARAEFADELRRHRAVVAAYRSEVKAIRQAIGEARDKVSGVALATGEAAVRERFLAALADERRALEPPRSGIGQERLERIERGEALIYRLAKLRERARVVKTAAARSAETRAGALRARIGSERRELQSHAGAIDGVVQEAKAFVGELAFRSFREVREQFYELVLKADVGIVDVAWSRKRERLDKIQQLSQQKATELQQLDRDFKTLLREVD